MYTHGICGNLLGRDFFLVLWKKESQEFHIGLEGLACKVGDTIGYEWGCNFCK